MKTVIFEEKYGVSIEGLSFEEINKIIFGDRKPEVVIMNKIDV